MLLTLLADYYSSEVYTQLYLDIGYITKIRSCEEQKAILWPTDRLANWLTDWLTDW
jgi:hypothetical protein